MQGEECNKEFMRLLQEISCKGFREREVFADFCKLAGISLAQPMYEDKDLEEQYLTTIKRYPKDVVHKFPQMLAVVTEALTEHRDFLGELFAKIDMGSKYKGQFFTPYNLAKMMAEMTMGGEDNKNSSKQLCEPCSGAGCLIIAADEVRKQTDVVAVDVDELCFYMCYVQLSLLNIPARVIHGNTLTMEYWKQLLTPAMVLKEANKSPEERQLEKDLEGL